MTQSSREIEFLYPLSEELEDRPRVSAVRQKDEIVRFVVQYEALISGNWKAIVRRMAWASKRIRFIDLVVPFSFPQEFSSHGTGVIFEYSR